jgi:HPt (histidine-containing phosphotransfer) domain-containing protein
MASGINPAAGGGSDYSILVHGIKGSARAIGGELVGNMAEELEKAAKSGNKDLVLEKNTAFITEIENLVARLREAVSQTETVHKEQREKPDITLLKRLADACDNYDVVAIDSTIQELEKYEYAEGGSIVEFIREQVDNYEFAAISEKIHTCT